MPPMKDSSRHDALLCFAHDDDGATSIEYALIATAIGLMLILAMPGVASGVQGIFNALTSGISSING